MNKQKIAIVTNRPCKFKLIEAEVDGIFAIHKEWEGKRWAVTHIPSGWNCVFTRTKKDAVQCLNEFKQFDWSGISTLGTFKPEFPKDDINAIRLKYIT